MNLDRRREPEIVVPQPQEEAQIKQNPELQGQATEVAEDLKEKTAGKLNKKYADQISELDKNPEKPTEKDRTTLKSKNIEDIRYASRILTKPTKEETDEEKIVNLKEETARRIRSYTDGFDGEWYTLNYNQMGSDSEGNSHEMNIGLGDILVDPDVTEIAVLKENGKIIKGTKGVATNGPRSGDIGFLDENGEYIATFSGDKFKLLSDNEVDTKDKTAVTNYLGFHAKDESTRETMYDHFQTTKASMERTEAADLQSGSDVVDQIICKLRENQKQMARLIEKEFKEAGFPSNLIAAALVNAWAESRFNPKAENLTKKEHSVGLFQLNSMGGLGDGMTVEEREDPITNIRKIIKTIKGKWGKKLVERANQGASVTELTEIFRRDIERGGTAGRKKYVQTLFGTKPLETSKSGESVNEELNFGPSKPGRINLKSNQDSWVIGSSGAQGIESKKVGSTGTIGVRGANVFEFGDKLPGIWEKIKNLKLPKQIVLVGMAANSLSEDNPEKIAKVIKGYIRIAEFFESKNVKVKIATVQPIKPALKSFNTALRNQYPKYVAGVDFEKAIRDENGQIKEGLAGGDGTHVNGKGYRIMAEMVDRSVKEES